MSTSAISEIHSAINRFRQETLKQPTKMHLPRRLYLDLVLTTGSYLRAMSAASGEEKIVGLKYEIDDKRDTVTIE